MKVCIWIVCCLPEVQITPKVKRRKLIKKKENIGSCRRFQKFLKFWFEFDMVKKLDPNSRYVWFPSMNM